MFGRLRKKITKQTIDAVRQPFSTFRHVYGVPRGFWHDEFVLSFFGMMIATVSKVAGSDRLTTIQKGQLTLDVFASLSNENGAIISQRHTQLGFQNPRSEAFELGVNNGFIVTSAMFGNCSQEKIEGLEAAKTKAEASGNTQESHTTNLFLQAVKAAKTEAEANGNSQDLSAVATILTTNLFLQPLIERFDLSKA